MELRKIEAFESADFVGKIQPATINPLIMLHLQLSEVNNYQPSMMASDVYMEQLDTVLLLCKFSIYLSKKNHVPIDLAVKLLSKQ